jgi:hypothetical protein
MLADHGAAAGHRVDESNPQLLRRDRRPYGARDHRGRQYPPYSPCHAKSPSFVAAAIAAATPSLAYLTVVLTLIF